MLRTEIIMASLMIVLVFLQTRSALLALAAGLVFGTLTGIWLSLESLRDIARAINRNQAIELKQRVVLAARLEAKLEQKRREASKLWEEN